MSRVSDSSLSPDLSLFLFSDCACEFFFQSMPVGIRVEVLSGDGREAWRLNSDPPGFEAVVLKQTF